jgi:2-polyprenyl-3-methyl-5-hydroxy-6-metoxy-1,4-benzoquinol methylase
MKWYDIIIEGTHEVNIERLNSLIDAKNYSVMGYVLRTLDYVSDYAKKTPLNQYLKEALQWSEVAKCGSLERRAEWREMGFNLSIHNIGSSEIYKYYNTDNFSEIVYKLIKVHGMIGQAIRSEISETSFDYMYILYDYLKESYSDQDIKDLFENMALAVTYGISKDLSDSIKDEAIALIDRISKHEKVITVENRLKRIKSDYRGNTIQGAEGYNFWFIEVALSSFTDDIFSEILKLVIKEADSYSDIENINFKQISQFLYHDYKGKKHINIYKKRIIENYITTKDDKHIKPKFTVADNVLFIGFELSPACEKLVNFCDEAELSGDISYEQAIILLFDLFNFRHDKLDRLYNEDEYLATMNDISESRKGELIDYIIGNRVCDVGSGSGILLDSIEERYPNKEIIGTDISETIIQKLSKKKIIENHSWEVIRHNFVEQPLSDKYNSIIFSSILHEIYSFSDIGNGRFDIKSVKNALKNAYDSLEKGGRILIRDGVKTDSKERVNITIKTESAFDFFQNYMKDFKGLTDYDRSDIQIEKLDNNQYRVTADINYIREYMFTLT